MENICYSINSFIQKKFVRFGLFLHFKKHRKIHSAFFRLMAGFKASLKMNNIYVC